ncbi:hypothetical protein ES703_21062 [subsurface metagenome]|nr:hypothetical protein [Dehalococcoidia bacterium]
MTVMVLVPIPSEKAEGLAEILLKENIKNNHYRNLVFLLMMIYPQFHQISTL